MKFFQADLFKILDEPLPTNGGNGVSTHNNIFDLLNTNDQQTNSLSNPLDGILFGDDLPKTQSTNGELNFLINHCLKRFCYFRYEFIYSTNESS
jgi:hypothetical protein